MAKRTRKSDRGPSGQLEFPELSEAKAGSLDLDHELRAWLVRAASRSSFSRAIVAARVGELVGRTDLSQAVFDAWCAESKEGYRVPAAYIPALCVVLRDDGGLRIMAQALGCDVIGPQERDALDLTRKRLQLERLQDEVRTIETHVRSQR